MEKTQAILNSGFKMVGIVGPYIGDGSHTGIENNIRNAECFAISLANRNIPFFCAHTHTRHFEIKATADEDFYKDLDLIILIKCCGALLAIPGWETSSGAKKEIEIFKGLYRPVFYPKNKEDLNLIMRWYESIK